MARKQTKKLSGKNELIIGIICLVLVCFGFIQIDGDGNIKPADDLTDEVLDYDEENVDNNSENYEDNFGNEEYSLEYDGTLYEDELYVFYLDVGQADSIFVYNNGESMLIDAGNNQDGPLVCDYLRTLGIDRIDYLVGTHPHEDHIGGLDDVINEFEIGKVLMPKKSANTKTFEDVIDAMRNNKLKAKSPKIGEEFRVGDAVCEVMCVDDNAKDANLSSIVIELTYNEEKYLFTGDMEAENEDSRDWNEINVLKVGHHGSNSSSTDRFLDQTNPEIAIVSCGPDNDYGHPHKEVLKRFKERNIPVERTDLNGTIVVISDGYGFDISYLDVCCDGNR